MTRPNLLIESWLPIEAIGAESKRERGASSALPPLYFLHVWWARRPLIASRAAILAGVLPAWSSDFPLHLRERFPNRENYQLWFNKLIGILGDPVKGMKIIKWANEKGIKLESNPYEGAPRAFTVNPSGEDLKLMDELFEFTWGQKVLSVIDPYSGGGSIPFEALRYGFSTIANDLNPVASVILKSTLDYPARFGVRLCDDIHKWGEIWIGKVRERLAPYFYKQHNESIFAYLWARTVQWHGKTIPLSPSWWLKSGDTPIAVNLIVDSNKSIPRFEIISGSKTKAVNPDMGTISRGVARSPWTNETIDGEYIKEEAQAGRLGQVLYAIAYKKTAGIEFRLPTQEDINCTIRAENEVSKRKSDWILRGIIPTEPFPEGNDNRPLLYGMSTWSDFFSPRQLLAMGIFLETLKEIEAEIRKVEPKEKADAIITYLGIALDKCPNYSSLLASWHAPRSVMRSVFDRHDFSFKWTYGEFDAADNLLPWAIDQVADAYKAISSLIFPAQLALSEQRMVSPIDNLQILKGSASNLKAVPDLSIHNITVDPPYYDNVQYAELSDFFYVWLKRSVGHLFPEYFSDELTNKDDETVANPARFNGMGKKRKELAEHDYENKMLLAFREMYRVLHPDGALTVMFTHKRVEAWDTLASALIGAGFEIRASWPVHTESEHSLHQAKKNAASSTIMLVCRKRENHTGESVWWEDIQNNVRQTARQRAVEFSQQGIHGVDLYIATFGPTLSIISENWPVFTSDVDEKTGQPKTLRPETALELAREEVVRLRKQGLLAGREVQFDPVTDWYLMAWDAFSAEEFPYDEARKLAIALGIDLDGDLIGHKRLLTKKGDFVVIQPPASRRKKGMVDDEITSFSSWIDAAHTTMMVYQEDGAGACDVFMMKAGLKQNTAFKACLQAMMNAIPRSRIKGKFVRPEAEVLDNLRLAFFNDLEIHEEAEPQLPVAVQKGLWEEPASDVEDEEE